MQKPTQKSKTTKRLSRIDKLKQSALQTGAALERAIQERNSMVDKNTRLEALVKGLQQAIEELKQAAACKNIAHNKVIKERDVLAGIITQIEQTSSDLRQAAKDQAVQDRNTLGELILELGRTAKETYPSAGRKPVNFNQTAEEAIDSFLVDQAR